MKHLLILILTLNVVGIASAQNRSTYTAYSAWVHVNTKPVVSKRVVTSPKALVIIDDDFTKASNPYGWITGELSGNSFLRGNGIYKIISSTGAADVCSVIDTKCSLDSVNFELETVLISRGGKISRAGLVWSYKDKDNYMAFKVNSQGGYAFIFMNSGENIADSNYKIYPGINKISGNKLTIKKTQYTLTFFINDQLVYTEQYSFMKSSRVGVITSDKDANFEKFKFKQLSN